MINATSTSTSTPLMRMAIGCGAAFLLILVCVSWASSSSSSHTTATTTATAAAAAKPGQSTAVAAAATPYAIFYVSAPSEDVADAIANKLVAAKVAACVNVLPAMSSVYRWKGKVEKGAVEVLLIVKSRRDLEGRIISIVKENHPFEVPEVIAVPVVGGLPAYLAWIDEEVKQ